MDQDLKKNIMKAKELWFNARHAAMATVNADGSPHNTPFHLIRDPDFKYVYWASYSDALHSQNILRTGKIFVVLYDTVDAEKGGLYVCAEKGRILEGDELAAALVINNELRVKEGKAQVGTQYYSGDNSQKMWSATITRLWINNPKRDEQGHLNRDSRREVNLNDLINL